jgi:RNA polymerase sigma-70 factor (ECF subfamily)
VSLAATCPILWGVAPRAETAICERADPDAADVARFRAGDDEAFEPLVMRREKEIYRLCSRMLRHPDDALDATQETFLRAFRGLRSFREDATFRTWITGIALNVCRNRFASAATRMSQRSVALAAEDPKTGLAHTIDPPDPRPDPESAACGAELGLALERALAALAPEFREALLLRQMQDLDYDEMARVLGCPVGTVKSRLSRARAALRVALEGVWP